MPSSFLAKGFVVFIHAEKMVPMPDHETVIFCPRPVFGDSSLLQAGPPEQDVGLPLVSSQNNHGIRSKFDFSRRIQHMCQLRLRSKSPSGDYTITLRCSFSTTHFIHSLRFTCHATCPLPQEYYSPRGRTVSTSHMRKLVRALTLR